VFDLPSSVRRVQIHGEISSSSSNFIIWCGSQLVVNEIIGPGRVPVSYDGTHLVQTPGCTVEVRNSTGVSWTITEVR